MLMTGLDTAFISVRRNASPSLSYVSLNAEHASCSAALTILLAWIWSFHHHFSCTLFSCMSSHGWQFLRLWSKFHIFYAGICRCNTRGPLGKKHTFFITENSGLHRIMPFLLSWIDTNVHPLKKKRRNLGLCRAGDGSKCVILAAIWAGGGCRSALRQNFQFLSMQPLMVNNFLVHAKIWTHLVEVGLGAEQHYTEWASCQCK